MPSPSANDISLPSINQVKVNKHKSMEKCTLQREEEVQGTNSNVTGGPKGLKVTGQTCARKLEPHHPSTFIPGPSKGCRRSQGCPGPGRARQGPALQGSSQKQQHPQELKEARPRPRQMGAKQGVEVTLSQPRSKVKGHVSQRGDPLNYVFEFNNKPVIATNTYGQQRSIHVNHIYNDVISCKFTPRLSEDIATTNFASRSISPLLKNKRKGHKRDTHCWPENLRSICSNPLKLSDSDPETFFMTSAKVKKPYTHSPNFDPSTLKRKFSNRRFEFLKDPNHYGKIQ